LFVESLSTLYRNPDRNELRFSITSSISSSSLLAVHEVYPLLDPPKIVPEVKLSIEKFLSGLKPGSSDEASRKERSVIDLIDYYESVDVFEDVVEDIWN